MSYLRQNKASCGRKIIKPFSVDDEDENDEELPLQTQIDNLRAKIALKERYNKALLQEVIESNAGAHQMIHDLYLENEMLRNDRNEAVKSGNAAAIKALRNNKEFLQALKGKSPETVLDFLEDQIFDLRKKLDEKTYVMALIRKKLEEAEMHVSELEKWPYPGSLPWEQEAINDFTRLGIAISSQDELRDCARILNVKYKEILTELRDGRAKWPHVVLEMEVGLQDLRNELIDLQNMLEDAIRLKKTSYYRLVMTEKEFSENRIIRHRRLIRMRKLCEAELQKNNRKLTRTIKKLSNSLKAKQSVTAGSLNGSDLAAYSILKFKRSKVEEFEAKARILVETMRVPDLRFCPDRIHTVHHLAAVLGDELDWKKEYLRKIILRKNNLILVKSYLLYTGANKLEKFEKIKRGKEQELVERIKKKHQCDSNVNRAANCTQQMRGGLIGLLNQLCEGKIRQNADIKKEDLEILGSLVKEKVTELVDTVDNLKNLFDPDAEPQRNYVQYIKVSTKDSSRIGHLYSADNDEDYSSEDEIETASSLMTAVGSDRVFDREELKARNERFLAQALLRRGHHKSLIKATLIRKCR